MGGGSSKSDDGQKQQQEERVRKQNNINEFKRELEDAKNKINRYLELVEDFNDNYIIFYNLQKDYNKKIDIVNDYVKDDMNARNIEFQKDDIKFVDDFETINTNDKRLICFNKQKIVIQCLDSLPGDGKGYFTNIDEYVATIPDYYNDILNSKFNGDIEHDYNYIYTYIYNGKDDVYNKMANALNDIEEYFYPTIDKILDKELIPYINKLKTKSWSMTNIINGYINDYMKMTGINDRADYL